jgi:hypothetical protein
MVHAMDVLYRKRCATQGEGMPLHPCSDVRHDFCSVNVYVKRTSISYRERQLSEKVAL